MPILSAAPNWRDPVTLRELYRTEIVEALSLAEERQQKFPRCLYGISFTTTLLTPREQGALRKQFELAGDAPFGVPMWTEQVRLTETAAAGVAELIVDDAEGTLFNAFGHVLIWQDQFTWEVLELTSATTDHIFLEEVTTQQWAAGTIVVPLAFGWCQRPNFNALQDERSAVEIVFEERWHALSNQSVATPPPDLPEPDPEYATNCRDTVTFTWGAQSAANMFRVEIGDAITGPWEVYTETIPGNATGVTLNNYFGGTKYLRLSVQIDGPGGSFWAPFAIKQPQAPMVAPPQFIELTNATQSSHPMRFLAPSGITGTPVSVVSNNENPLVGSDAYIEVVDRWEFQRVQGESLEALVTWAHDDEEATIRWTRDGSAVTASSTVWTEPADIVAHSSTFGHILRARAFKGGCQSPEIAVYVDRNNKVSFLFSHAGLTIGISTSCDWIHMTTGCNNSGQACIPSAEGEECSNPPDSDAAGEVAMANAVAATCLSAMGGPASPSVPWTLWAHKGSYSGPDPGINFFEMHGSASKYIFQTGTFNYAGAAGLWTNLPAGLHCVLTGDTQDVENHTCIEGGFFPAGNSLTGPSGNGTAITAAYNARFGAFALTQEAFCAIAGPPNNPATNVLAPIPSILTTIEDDFAS